MDAIGLETDFTLETNITYKNSSVVFLHFRQTPPDFVVKDYEKGPFIFSSLTLISDNFFGEVKNVDVIFPLRMYHR